MNTETKKRGRGRWIYPLLLALPFLAAIAFGLIRYGADLLDVINVMIKTAVIS